MINNYSQLIRLNKSLENMWKCILNQLELSESNGLDTVYRSLNDKMRIAYPKTIKLTDKSRFVRILENMWLNELYIKTLTEENKELVHWDQLEFEFPKGHNHFFFMDYIAFYYSLFNAISLVTILFEQNTKKEKHKSKIHSFNSRLSQANFLKNSLIKPFSLVIFKDKIWLDNKENDVNDDFRKKLTKVIKNYPNHLDDKDKILDCEYAHRFSNSLIKHYLKTKKKNRMDSCSFVDYLLCFRHYFHYYSSLIIDNSDYEFHKLVHNTKKQCCNVLSIFNYSIEILFYKITKENIKDTFKNFESKLISKSKDYKEEPINEIKQRLDWIY